MILEIIPCLLRVLLILFFVIVLILTIIYKISVIKLILLLKSFLGFVHSALPSSSWVAVLFNLALDFSRGSDFLFYFLNNQLIFFQLIFHKFLASFFLIFLDVINLLSINERLKWVIIALFRRVTIVSRAMVRIFSL